MENKKVKFNGIDVLIIVLIIAVACAGFYILYGRNQAGVVSAQDTKVTVVVELTGREQNLADEIKVGDTVMIGEKDKMPAVVENVEIVPAKMTGYDTINGAVKNSLIPGQVDIRITMSGDGSETEKSVEISGVSIRVGEETVVASKGWAGKGYVIGLETDSKK